MSVDIFEVLVFDIWGDFAHFKKFYTTSSPLTFSIPPPTTVFGIIGAILGLDKREYLKYVNGRTTGVAVEILSHIKKTRMTLNYIDTKASFNYIKNRIQIRTEFLKDPFYRLYIRMNDDKLFNDLVDKVKNKESYYTVSFGLANLLANYRYVGLFKAEALEDSDVVNTSIFSKNVKKINFVEGRKYFREKFPVDMNSNRMVLSYEDIILELSGQGLEGSFTNCYKINDKVISFITP